MTHTLFVCTLCRYSQTETQNAGVSGGEHLIAQLRQELETRQLSDQLTLEPVRCMAACDDFCNATLAAPGKLTFILKGLSPTESAAALSEFCEQYAASPGGKVPYRERPQEIHQSTAYVLPPLPAMPSSSAGHSG